MRNLLKAALRRLEGTRGSYRDVFGRPSGRIVLADLARKFGGTAYVADDPNGRRTAFNEGTRYVVNHVRAMIAMTDDELYSLAHEELHDGRAADGYGTDYSDDPSR